MKKPESTLIWATKDSRKMAPDDEDKKLGWSPNRAPVIGWLNWWMNLAYQWQNYFKECVDTLLAKQDKQENAIKNNSVLAQKAKATHEVNQKTLGALKTTQKELALTTESVRVGALSDARSDRKRLKVLEKQQKEIAKELCGITAIMILMYENRHGHLGNQQKSVVMARLDELKEYAVTSSPQ